MRKPYVFFILLTSFVLLVTNAWAVEVGPPYQPLTEEPITIYASDPDGSYRMTTDDAFKIYISQNDFTQGTLIGTGNNWQTAYLGSLHLVAGQTNYLHIVGRDEHQTIAGFLGEFSLNSDNPFIFQNGTKYLLTNTTDWTVRTTGWDNSFAPVTSSGTNATAQPWLGVNGGPVSGINPNAEWIWTNNGLYTDSPRYFSTRIISTPEPVSAALFLIGGGALAFYRRKKAIVS